MIVFALGMSRPFSTIVVASEHVVLVRHEVEHRLLELLLSHLPVPDGDLRLGHEPRDQVRNREDRLDAVVDDVDLPAAFQLVANRAANHFGVELHDVGLDRQAVLRRRLDHRHVADADERHVERPRDGRGRHREDVDPLPELLDLLLVRDAEPLLLVHDEQPEVAELHVLREQPVRADDDLDLGGSKVFENRLSVPPSCETG